MTQLRLTAPPEVVREDRYRALALLEPIASEPEFHVVVVPGEPISKARPRWSSGGKGGRRTYTPTRTIEGEKAIAWHLVNLPTFKGNVAIACVFYRSSHQRVDIDNLLKAVLDAGTRAAMWEDDSQVTFLTAVLEHDRDGPRTIIAFCPHASTLRRGEAALETCEACGKHFQAPGNRRRGRARWCSRECRIQLAELVPCGICGQPFRRRSGNQKLCSQECQHESNRRRNRARKKGAAA